MKKNGIKFLAVFGIILLAGNFCVTAASLSCSLKAMKNSDDAKKYSSEAKEEAQKYGDEAKAGNEEIKALLSEASGLGETKEDDVRIAGQYTIRSTKQISDAYISGDSSELSDKDKETLQMASDVLDEIVKDEMSAYEKEKAVYDWMTKELGQDAGALLVIPTASGEVDNPHGVLKSGQAVCVGYATTFRLFMQMLGIECKVVHNTDNFHSWDLVNLDGDWYHVDIYSDVSVGNYSHFNLCDTMMTQAWDTEYFPAANGLKYNYFYDSIVTVDDVYSIPAAVRSAIDDRRSGLLIKKKGELKEADMYAINDIMSVISNSMMDNPNISMQGYVDGMDATATDAAATGNIVMPIGISSFSLVVDPSDNGYLLFIVFERYADETDDMTSDEAYDEIDRDKINEELDNAFGDVFEGINLDMQFDYDMDWNENYEDDSYGM